MKRSRQFGTPARARQPQARPPERSPAPRIARTLRRALLALTLLVGGSSTIGLQDITGRLAHQPGVAERARISILAGPVHTLKAAAFAWPGGSSLLSGSAISEPPPALPPTVAVERATKGDRLPVAAAEMDMDPLAAAGTRTGPSLAGTGTGTGAEAFAALTPGGTGTDTAGAISTGTGTDPAEADDADAGTDSPGVAAEDRSTEMAELDRRGVDSLSAGDPTGDPTQLEAAQAEALAAAVAPRSGTTEDARPGFDAHVPLYHQAAFVFGTDMTLLPPQPFHHLGEVDGGLPAPPLPPSPPGGTTTAAKDGQATPADAATASGPSPAERLGLSGKRRARAEKCLAEAVYFESRGEPRRGQVAVAQVVINRVFSGYYPADICRAVYQNANRKLSCQFTFACDNIPDVVTEPRLWKQAKDIAAAMLDGLAWDDKVGRATHYHAQSVRPNWIREMRKLDRIGEHTFYRPRRWTS